MTKEPAHHEASALQSERNGWQKQLLPLMSGSIVLLGVFFLAASLYQLYSLQSSARHGSFNLAPTFDSFEQRSPDSASDQDYLRLKVLALLEQNAVERRYHQANAAMLARVWTRYLGFLTGMILSLVGSAFILGKLQGEQTRVNAGSNLVTASLRTSSPGIVLAFLGTVLMLTTLMVRFEISTTDLSVYLHGQPVLPVAPDFIASPDELDRIEEQLFGKGPDADGAAKEGGGPRE